jgi:hypothetical protein
MTTKISLTSKVRTKDMARTTNRDNKANNMVVISKKNRTMVKAINTVAKPISMATKVAKSAVKVARATRAFNIAVREAREVNSVDNKLDNMGLGNKVDNMEVDNKADNTKVDN